MNSSSMLTILSVLLMDYKKYFRELGIKTRTIADNKLEELFQLSLRMFDTRLPPGVTVMSPFADDSSLTKIGVEVCHTHTLKVQTCKQISCIFLTNPIFLFIHLFALFTQYMIYLCIYAHFAS